MEEMVLYIHIYVHFDILIFTRWCMSPNKTIYL